MGIFQMAVSGDTTIDFTTLGNIQRQTPICQLFNTLSFFYANVVALPTLIIDDTALTVITIHTNSIHSDMFYV